MYTERLKKFTHTETLGGKAWQHALAIETIIIKDCAMHCFHYQQMFEMLFKFLLETKSKYGAYSHTHKLPNLLEQIIEMTAFKTNKVNYKLALQVITVCAEEYRYNFLIDCESYQEFEQSFKTKTGQLICSKTGQFIYSQHVSSMTSVMISGKVDSATINTNLKSARANGIT